MNTHGMKTVTIGVNVGWTKIGALPADHTYVELYNIYAHDPVTGKELVMAIRTRISVAHMDVCQLWAREVSIKL